MPRRKEDPVPEFDTPEEEKAYWEDVLAKSNVKDRKKLVKTLDSLLKPPRS